MPPLGAQVKVIKITLLLLQIQWSYNKLAEDYAVKYPEAVRVSSAWITALLHTTQSCIASNVVCSLNYIVGKLPCDVSLWVKK